MKTISISSICSSVTFWKFLWGLDNYLVFYRPLFTRKTHKNHTKFHRVFLDNLSWDQRNSSKLSKSACHQMRNKFWRFPENLSHILTQILKVSRKFESKCVFYRPEYSDFFSKNEDLEVFWPRTHGFKLINSANWDILWRYYKYCLFRSTFWQCW